MSFKPVGKLSPIQNEVTEPVGPAFLAHARRMIRNRTWSEHERIEAEELAKRASTVKEDDDGLESEDEDPEIMRHDPKDWKNVDQYAALGITKLRWRATEDQIRKAHRRQVLRHHPDKKAASGSEEDGFFKIIQKAFEMLGDPVKRRQWDSVDKKANVPAPKKTTPGDFFERWGKVFEAEGRFSTKQPVPQLGGPDAAREDVDRFYSFWYAFDSWRTFEWLDEDVPDDSSNRDNKRFIEKKNKAQRAKHKKEDNARLRKLVDTALSEDPRIRAFKEAEKKAKEQRKWEREAGTREAAAKKAKEQEEAEKAKAAAVPKTPADKKAKEAAKNAKKKNKRAVRGAVKTLEESLPAAESQAMVADVDALLEKLDDLQLGEAATTTSALNGEAAVKEYFTETLKAKGIAAKYFQ